jgi:hypothetical protein
MDTDRHRETQRDTGRETTDKDKDIWVDMRRQTQTYAA